MARRWVKIWVTESLTGTIRFDFNPAERGVWYDLLVLAGNCRKDGLIAAGEGVPYPDNWIAGTLNVPLKLLKDTLKKCVSSGRIEGNGNGYRIINWEKYQSEYERQKQYRPNQHKGMIMRDYTPKSELGEAVKEDSRPRKQDKGAIEKIQAELKRKLKDRDNSVTDSVTKSVTRA